MAWDWEGLEVSDRHSLSPVSRLSSVVGVSRLSLACSPGSRCQLPLFLAQDLVCDWQQAASDVLVAVGTRFVSSVMEELLHGLQPGVLPHYFVVRTLANLSVSNGRWLLGLDPGDPEPLGTWAPVSWQPHPYPALSTHSSRSCSGAGGVPLPLPGAQAWESGGRREGGEQGLCDASPLQCSARCPS